MARRRNPMHQQQHVKGFRPGKEPAKLRKQHAKKAFGDLTKSQARLVDLFADRTPEESRKLIRRWKTGSLISGIVLSILTVLAFMWSWIPGVIVGILASVVFFAHFRLRASIPQLEQMADAVAQVTGKTRR